MWQRKIELQIKNKDTGEVLLSTSENRIDFVYQGKLSWMADTLKIDVYNLGPDVVKMLLDTARRSVKLDVGYADEPVGMATLLDGYVVNVAGRKAIPNHITSIWCVPNSAETLSSNAGLNKLEYKNGDLRGLIQAISKSAGYSSPPRFFGLDDDVLNHPIKSYSLRGTVTEALSALGHEYSFYVRGTNSEIQIVNRMNSANTLAKIKSGQANYHKMSIDKLKGTPQASVAMIDYSTNLDASIDCGDVVNVSEFLGARTNDPNRPPADAVISVNNADSILFRSDSLWSQTVFEEYLVLFIQHVGSNYAAAWETRITGVQFNEGLVGSKDVSGNGRGKGTWDIDVDKEVAKQKGIPQVRQSMPSSSYLSESEQRALTMVQLSPEQNTAIERVAQGNQQKANFLRDKLAIENRGNKTVRNAVSPAGAAGPYQFMPNTARSLGLTVNGEQDDRNDFEKSTYAAGKLYDELDKRYDGNIDAMNANYNAGNEAASIVQSGGEAPAEETRDYIRMARGLDELRSEV